MKTALAVLAAAVSWAVLAPGAARPAGTPTATSSAVAPPGFVDAAIPEDPAIHRGVLANGLRYAVMHAARPVGGVSVRLAIAAGSIDESDTERGIAHFIEHMAFRSTRDFPDSSVDRLFAGRGLHFGRDLNAGTGLRDTRFKLDLPTAKTDDLDLALRWLRNVADGMTFEAAAIDKERGVVLAEKEARDNAESIAEDAVTRFDAPGALSTLRNPIGEETVLRGATSELLSAFYRRWYRPDDAIVIMVGDLTVSEMEGRIRSTFGSWRADGPAPQRGARPAPDPGRGLDVVSIRQPKLLDAIDICRVGRTQATQPDDLARARRDALSEAWRYALDRRLLSLREDPANSLVGARTVVTDNDADVRAVCVDIYPAAGGWSVALKAVARELKRFADDGPTELEFEKAVEGVRGTLRGAITESRNRESATLADRLVEAQLRGGVVPEPRQALAAFDTAIEDFTVADARGSFAADWAGAGPLVSMSSASAPTTEALRAEWLAIEGGGALRAYADRKAVNWAYDFGPAGAVVSRRAIDTGGYVSSVFRNGVRLNFKRTDFATNAAQLTIRFGSGRRELAANDYFAAVLGGTLFVLGGVGKHSFEDIQTLYHIDPKSLRLVPGDDAFYLTATVTRPNLSDQLTVLAAYLSDPAFRPSLDSVLREAVDATYRLMGASPYFAANVALTERVSPGGSQNLPPRAALAGLDGTRVSALLQPSITRDPLDVTIVGDIDEAGATALVARTLGALPPRRSPLAPRADAATGFLRFPPTAAATIHVDYHGPPDKAAALAVWPLYVATPARRREEYALRLLAAVFNDQLRRRVRVELGKSYAPRAAAVTPDDTDQGQLVATVESYPVDAAAMLGEIRAIAGRLRDGAVTQDELDAARAPMLADDRRAMASNEHWALALSGSAASDQNLRDALGFSDSLASIRLDEVTAVAARWLAAEPWTVVAMPAAAGEGSKP